MGAGRWAAAVEREDEVTRRVGCWAVAWLTVGLTVVGCASSASSGSSSPPVSSPAQRPGFDSPEAAIKDFVDGLRSADLARSLSITNPVAVPGPADKARDRLAKNFETQAKLYGADQLVQRLWLYEFDGKSYLGGASLVHFADGWKILNLGSYFGRMSATGAVAAGTQGDIDAIPAG